VISDQQAHGVVTAIAVAEAEHLHGHVRSIVRSRKCVAHEMHGS
jgi:hypothetical protein